ncbi:HTH-type transcriptional repressor FabR [Saccharobesus litoralis]|uniref:HTH-type transcriptional repressor FabR n=1 Tax=Saccharobesus litoralis TaxID=2172099 RepID=A0A2S0VSF9_9ALTE|nr:HTH-type transcriptional repressor FabR [Saccharobesus litoralis]AWB67123.1 HTH-type transcriptional repressor FabR [Saccharobesus litoralis]
MSGIRAQQKAKTRQAIIQAAFSQLTAERSFSNLSLREVAREAGIAPTSFYRHFEDLNDLGLTLVDEAGLLLRQLMRQARKRIEDGGSVIQTSIDTFMEFLDTNENEFRILLQEKSGTTSSFRTAVAREIQHFIAELSEYIEDKTLCNHEFAYLQAESMVKLVFAGGAEAIDMKNKKREELAKRLVIQLRVIAKGAAAYAKQARSVLTV